MIASDMGPLLLPLMLYPPRWARTVGRAFRCSTAPVPRAPGASFCCRRSQLGPTGSMIWKRFSRNGHNFRVRSRNRADFFQLARQKNPLLLATAKGGFAEIIFAKFRAEDDVFERNSSAVDDRERRGKKERDAKRGVPRRSPILVLLSPKHA